MAVIEGMNEGLWLWGLLFYLGIKQECVNMICDSQSVIHLVKNQFYHTYIQYIDFIYYFLRDVIEESNIYLLINESTC